MNKTQYPAICYIQKTHFGFKDIFKLKLNIQKNAFYAYNNQKKSKLDILTDFKSKLLKEAKMLYHYIIINKMSVYQGDITIIKYSPNIRVSKYVKNTFLELKGEIVKQ